MWDKIKWWEKRRSQAPVNGGRNYNGPKVNDASLSKTELYAGNSSTAIQYSPEVSSSGSKNLIDMGTIRREGSN